MDRHLFRGFALAACLLAGLPSARAQAPAAATTAAATTAGTKVAIINIQDAVTRTQEGQKRLAALQEEYRPKGEVLSTKAQEVQTLRQQLAKGANTMSEEAQRNLQRDIQQKERDLKRDNEDLEAEFGRRQQEVLNEIFGKVKAVIQKYAREQGYSIVLDISSPQSPVVDAFNELDITGSVIQRYDEQYPQQAAAAPAPAAAKPAASQ
jgi:outer membrane protein